MDSRSAPEGIRCGHFPGQGGDLGVDGRAAGGGPAGELGPVLAEAAPLPPQDGVGRNDHEGLPPPGPDPGQPDLEETISRAKLGPGGRSLVHGELVAQGEVLQGELTGGRHRGRARAAGGDHRARILSGSEPTDQPLGPWTEFWRRTPGNHGNATLAGRCSRSTPTWSKCELMADMMLRPC